MDTGFAGRSFTILCLLIALFAASPGSSCLAGERRGTVTFTIDVNAPREANGVKLWFPYPTTDLDQKIENLQFHGNYTRFNLSREPESGSLYLYTEWAGPLKKPNLTVTFHAVARERRVANLKESGAAIPAQVKKYLNAEFFVPSDNPKIKAMARQIVAGKRGMLEKARAVYDWTVDNTNRDPNVPGCGLGNVEATIASRSGKCADISSVFVALARAAGIPAREIFGLRLGTPGQTDITDGHHCWAEFYLPGSGWVPVDPADVVKLRLERKLSPQSLRYYRDYYFGGVDQYRVTLHKGGRGISFSEGNVQRVNYFMYPYAEVDGKALDYCRPRTFHFTVAFRED